MADSLMPLLDRLDAKIQELNARNAELQLVNDQLRSENEDLKRKAEEAYAARDKAQLDADYLTVSHRLADNPDTLIATRRQISQMIRNIDRCLEMLKE